MPTFAIVIGVYPTSPQTTAADFVANYLNGLTITAYEVDCHGSPGEKVVVASKRPPKAGTVIV